MKYRASALRKAFVLSVIVLSFIVIPGCGSLAVPRVDYAAPKGDTLLEASARVTETKLALQSKVNSYLYTVAGSKLGVLVGALGSTTAALYGAHRDAVLGLALLGGASYAASSVYAPPVYLQIYNAGLIATQCVDSLATPASGSFKAVKNGVTAVRGSLDNLRTVLSDPANKGASTSVVLTGRSALAQGSNVLIVTDSITARETNLGSAINTAIDQILTTVNDQLDKNTPNIDAILAMANSAFAVARGIVGSSAASDLQSALAKPAPRAASALGERMENPADTAINLAVDAASVTQKNLGESIKAFEKTLAKEADLGACPQLVRVAVQKPLTFEPDDTDIPTATGKEFNLMVSGGQGSYSRDWVGDAAPAADVEITQQLRAMKLQTFLIKIKNKLTKDYKFRITDIGTGEAKTFTLKATK